MLGVHRLFSGRLQDANRAACADAVKLRAYQRLNLFAVELYVAPAKLLGRTKRSIKHGICRGVP